MGSEYFAVYVRAGKDFLEQHVIAMRCREYSHKFRRGMVPVLGIGTLYTAENTYKGGIKTKSAMDWTKKGLHKYRNRS